MSVCLDDGSSFASDCNDSQGEKQNFVTLVLILGVAKCLGTEIMFLKQPAQFGETV